MEGQRLILADGTTIEGATAGYSDGYLWLWFPGWTMAQTAAVVLNREAMKKIYFQYGEEEEVYSGFTVCVHMKQDETEAAACMVKG